MLLSRFRTPDHPCIPPSFKLEAARVADDEQVVGEGGVTVRSVLDVRDASSAIALQRDRDIHRDRMPPRNEEDTGINGNHVARPPKAIARAEDIADTWTRYWSGIDMIASDARLLPVWTPFVAWGLLR